MRIQETNNERTADEYLHDKQSVKDPDGKVVEKKIGVSDRKFGSYPACQGRSYSLKSVYFRITDKIGVHRMQDKGM